MRRLYCVPGTNASTVKVEPNHRSWVQDLASLWYKIIRTEPFASPRVGDWLRSTGESDRIPQPGFVGARYREGGTLLLGMNPGGKGKTDTEHDKRFFDSLGCLAGSDDDPVQSFLEWNIVFEEVACTWRPYYPNLMSPILQKLDKKLADVAYLNVLKWRNRPEANHVRPVLYDLSWEAHTRDQVTLLNPNKIIVLGKKAADWFTRKYEGKAGLHIIPRTRGDHHFSRITRSAIDQLPGPGQCPMPMPGKKPTAKVAKDTLKPNAQNVDRFGNRIFRSHGKHADGYLINCCLCDTPKTTEEIAAECGLPLERVKSHLNHWYKHPDEKLGCFLVQGTKGWSVTI